MKTLFSQLIVLAGLAVVIQLATGTVWAVTPTPTPVALPTASLTSVPASQTGTVNQNLKKVIDKVVEENKDAINARLQTAEDQRRGLVGQVRSVREGTLTISTPKGTQLIPTDKNVQLIKAGKLIAVDAIAIDDWVTVIGTIKDGDFRAETVIVSLQSLQTVKPVVALGTIKTLTKSAVSFSDRASQDTRNWQLDRTVQWQDALGAKTGQTSFAVSLQALFIGVESNTSTTAKIIRALAPFVRPTQPAR